MEQNLCFNCFRGQADSSAPCPYCGYDPAGDQGKYPFALPHGSILAGQYIIGRVLGQGGFGITYLALDKTLDMKVAIKEFMPDSMAARVGGSYQVTLYTGQREDNFRYGMDRFLEEARVLAKFQGNPNIVGVRSYFEENGTAYFVMDYIEGESFKEYVKRQGGRILWRDSVRILLPVMDALTAVHREGIIHRDVTPDNIVLTRDGGVKLLDFGAARYSLGEKSQSLDVVLKAGYAPKEQYIRRGKQGPYTDVYSLAACFYATITGYLPPESLERMDYDDIIAPSARGIQIPSALEDVIFKGLEVQPADRYQSMEEFREALNAAVWESEHGPARQPYPGRQVQPQPAIRFQPADQPQAGPVQPQAVYQPQAGGPVQPQVGSVRPQPVKGIKGKWPIVGAAALAAVAVCVLLLRAYVTPKPVNYIPYVNNDVLFSLDYPEDYDLLEPYGNAVQISDGEDFRVCVEYAYRTTRNSYIYSAGDFADQIDADGTLLAEWLGLDGVELIRSSRLTFAGRECYEYDWETEMDGNPLAGALCIMDSDGEFGCYTYQWMINSSAKKAEAYQEQLAVMKDSFRMNGKYQEEGYSLYHYTFDGADVKFILQDDIIQGEVEQRDSGTIVVHPVQGVYSEANLYVTTSYYDADDDIDTALEGLCHYYFEYKDHTRYTSQPAVYQAGIYQYTEVDLEYYDNNKKFTNCEIIFLHKDHYWRIYLNSTDENLDAIFAALGDVLYSLRIT